MGNVITTDPIYLDTANGAISLGRTFKLFKSVEWVNPTTAGDEAKLLDANGNAICDFYCDVAHKSIIKYFGEKGQQFDGPLNLATLTSGHLLLTQM